MTTDPPDSKSKRGVSVRLDSEPMERYETCVSAAGLSAASALRASVTATLAKLESLASNGLAVSCAFTPIQVDAFPELLGNILLEVTPPADVSVEDLHRLVFVMPEFFVELGHEPYRVDSAHFQRVASNKREVSSTKVTRNVLSFRLVDGAWSGSVFDYGVGLNRLAPDEIVKRVEAAMQEAINATVACFLSLQLPASRILSAAEVDEMNQTQSPR